MLENLVHEKSTFVTLTYSEETVSYIEQSCVIGMTLVPRDLETWLKRMRKAVMPERLRFFGIGEYGSKWERPHFHVALFGVEGCVYSDSRLAPERVCSCASCVRLRDTWGAGFVHQGTIELKSMQYLCSYMLKGMYRRDDVRLHGREPEFRRMSLRPGIGAGAAVYLANALRSAGMGEDRVTPAAYRFGSRILPIGKYVRGKVRKELGFGEKATEEEVLVAKERLRPLYDIAARLTEKTVSRTVSDKLLYRLLVEANKEKARQLEVREKIFTRSGK